MAYPVIEDVVYGVCPQSYNWVQVPMPQNLQRDDYIIGFLATGEDGWSSNSAQSGNFHIQPSVSDILSIQHLTCFHGRALGGGDDWIHMHFYGGYHAVQARYIVYRISGHGMYSNYDFTWNWHAQEYTGNLYMVPYNSQAEHPYNNFDKLFITAISYSNRNPHNFQIPSGWSALVWVAPPSQGTYPNDYIYDYQAGIAAASSVANANFIPLNWWNNDHPKSMYSTSITVAIKEGLLPNTPPTGVGLVVPHAVYF